ncbi:glycoside hydrolase family 16 protein [Natrinema versiforme]|uniref:Glycoside hydrolase family protein n=1 Tax=Natrinema versiforme JCM 10478 TaxID=1227496 RepID=L9Y0N7_9EURY|nr:glycoside hydrolase family 16 protein [Natrinema versiforme]ELY67287.1 glycoside hydrolase family protein [Natrinema versiforme JCM 10478]
MPNEPSRADRRTILRTSAGALAALGAGCFSVEPPGARQNESANETPANETVPDISPADDDELELVFEDWFEENTVDAGVWETEFPWGERIHNFNAYAPPDNAYVYEDKLVLKAIEQRWEVPDGARGDDQSDTDANETDGEIAQVEGNETATGTDGNETAPNATASNGTAANETASNETTDSEAGETGVREPANEGSQSSETDDRDTVPYTTGVATPYRSFGPGYIEGRIRIPPTVKGFWPAFWLTPDDQWPPEIDIFEFFGTDPCPHMTYYYRDSDGNIQTEEETYCGPDFSGDFHNYAVDWREDRIVWYIDGEERFRFEDEAQISTDEMRLILNFGLDAPFLETPNSADLPAYMEIDRVRVWER